MDRSAITLYLPSSTSGKTLADYLLLMQVFAGKIAAPNGIVYLIGIMSLKTIYERGGMETWSFRFGDLGFTGLGADP
jgi:hypothetical protein